MFYSHFEAAFFIVAIASMVSFRLFASAMLVLHCPTNAFMQTAQKAYLKWLPESANIFWKRFAMIAVTTVLSVALYHHLHWHAMIALCFADVTLWLLSQLTTDIQRKSMLKRHPYLHTL